jgi:hypothetical protein
MKFARGSFREISYWARAETAARPKVAARRRQRVKRERRGGMRYRESEKIA